MMVLLCEFWQACNLDEAEKEVAILEGGQTSDVYERRLHVRDHASALHCTALLPPTNDDVAVVW
jgi:hypothetical protein